MIDLGWALVHLGDIKGGFVRLAEGRNQLDRIGVRIWLSRAKRMNAEACLAAERYDEGLQEVGRAISIANDIGYTVTYPDFACCKASFFFTPPGEI